MKKALALGLVVLAAGGAGAAAAGSTAQAGEGVFFSFSAANGPAHGAAQGYLGVDLRDVSEDRLAALKLKEPRGAEITLVDHDAPAGKAGLREHDVVIQVNGLAVEGEDQVRRLLRECAPGATVVLTISRDGQQITKTAQMANRSDVEREAWERRIIVPEPQETPLPESASAPGYAGGAAAGPAARSGNSFMGTILMNPAYTGAVLGRMTSQLAQFFGVANGTGLLVQSVATNSPAAQAGMRVGDVVVRADARAVASTSDWTKAIKNSHGRPLSVVVLRDKREQTLTLVPDGKRRSSLEQPDADSGGAVVAHLGLSWMPRS